MAWVPTLYQNAYLLVGALACIGLGWLLRRGGSSVRLGSLVRLPERWANAAWAAGTVLFVGGLVLQASWAHLTADEASDVAVETGPEGGRLYPGLEAVSVLRGTITRLPPYAPLAVYSNASVLDGIEGRCTEVRLVGMDASGAAFEGVAFRGVVFERVNLTGARFSNCTFDDVAFAGCALDGVALEGCRVNRAAVLADLGEAEAFLAAPRGCLGGLDVLLGKGVEEREGPVIARVARARLSLALGDRTIPVEVLTVISASDEERAGLAWLGLGGVGWAVAAAAALRRDPKGRLLTAAGWVAYGVFWIAQAPYWYVAHRDTLNAAFCVLALPFFGYIAYHDRLSYKWGEEIPGIVFLAGWTFIASAVYFAVKGIPPLAGGLIRVVSDQSVWVLNHFSDGGYDVGPVDYGGSEPRAPIRYMGEGTGVSIILACTGIQSIMLIAAAIAVTQATSARWTEAMNDLNAADGRGGVGAFIKRVRQARRGLSPAQRKAESLLITVPLIYIINLFRNADTIWVTRTDAFGGWVESAPGWLLSALNAESSFDLAHNVIGKVLALVVLLLLMLYLFTVLPEFLDHVFEIIDLRQRKGPGWSSPGARPAGDAGPWP